MFLKVYPRVCGGTEITQNLLRYDKGLSPRVRGNLQGDRYGKANQRSIPACAGEPVPPAQQKAVAEVYPRVCGGTWALLVEGVAAWGLSPRVRGNLRRNRHAHHWQRSIPACAGEPDPAGGGRRWEWVYPRVCGGTIP